MRIGRSISEYIVYEVYTVSVFLDKDTMRRSEDFIATVVGVSERLGEEL